MQQATLDGQGGRALYPVSNLVQHIPYHLRRTVCGDAAHEAHMNPTAGQGVLYIAIERPPHQEDWGTA